MVPGLLWLLVGVCKGLRVEGFWFRVENLGNLGFRVQDSGLRILDVGFKLKARGLGI